MKRMATVLLLPTLLMIGCSGTVEPVKVQLAAIKFDELMKNRIPEHKGKIVVLDIWGTWCPSCKKEFHNLISMHEKYSAKGVQCMSLCIPLDDGDVKDQPGALAFLEGKKALIPNYWLEDGMAPVQKRFNFDGLPVVVVFGKDGQIAKTFKVEPPATFTYEDVEKLTKDLLDGKKTS